MKLVALDFDGVLCDSAGETAESSWRAGAELWPEWRDKRLPPAFKERFRELRPVIEIGYETVPLMRLIADGCGRQDILENFKRLCAQVLRENGVSQERMVALFGHARDRWIRDDLDSWLAEHRFYPGTVEVVRKLHQQNRLFILTTKQERFVHALLKGQNAPLPQDRVMGLETGRVKEDILQEFVAGGRVRTPGDIVFVEDRIDTLKRVAAVPELRGIRLLLADWGFNLPEQRKDAAEAPFMELISLDCFAKIPLVP